MNDLDYLRYIKERRPEFFEWLEDIKKSNKLSKFAGDLNRLLNEIYTDKFGVLPLTLKEIDSTRPHPHKKDLKQMVVQYVLFNEFESADGFFLAGLVLKELEKYESKKNTKKKD